MFNYETGTEITDTIYNFYRSYRNEIVRQINI